MKLAIIIRSTLLSVLLGSAAFAGPILDSKNLVEERRTFFPEDPAGSLTLGTQFSEHATGVYLDGITGLWAPQQRDAYLFLNSRFHLEDNGQSISTIGLGFRKLLPERDVIVGANVFWDSIITPRDNNFDQLGVGVEVLTRWVDARFNYYAPEDDHFEIGRSRRRSSEVRGGSLIQTTRNFKRFEAGVEGLNTEVGFLIPGLHKYAEVRIYAGYYHYNNPFGSDFDGFKARLEARVLPGVLFDVEYWDDAALMGGHWTAGVRVSVPFSIYNLVHGRNPFEGAGEFFTPREREFSERMSEMVIRSHRFQTVASGNIPSGTSISRTSLDAPAPAPAPIPVPLE